MFLLAGLMGVLAVGATALVGLEVVSDHDSEDETHDDVAEIAKEDGAEPYDLVEIAANLMEALPDVAPVAPAMMAADADLDASPDDDTDAESGRMEDHIVAAPGAIHENLTAIEFLTGLHQEEVEDFLPEEDALVIIYDDLTDPDPAVGLEEDEDDPSRTHVTLNGNRVAAVDAGEGLTLDHIMLVPESSFDAAAAA